MTSFFDKLKKGMDIETRANLKKEKIEPIEDISSFEDPEEFEQSLISETPQVKEASLSNAVSKIFNIEGEKKKKKKKKPEKIKVEVVPKEPEPIKEVKTNKKEWFESEGQLVVDVYEADGEVVVQSAIAGLKPEDLDISIEKDMIVIKGERKEIREKSDKNYFFQECHWGKFSREIILPVEVDGARAKADLKEGILTIRMPKIEREGVKKITIR
ncbi:MAG: Hsp20/alpha crystallin family protein [Candidatus Pacebacteria bacterium]|nr:Hsp20/alpha crystallin family protein [Candidatus Paceibacterota bacterium]